MGRLNKLTHLEPWHPVRSLQQIWDQQAREIVGTPYEAP